MLRISIDRGGTFTDVIAHAPTGAVKVFKVLSEDGSGVDPTLRALRAALGLGPDLVTKFFPGLQSPIGGIELADIGAAVIAQTEEPGSGPRPVPSASPTESHHAVRRAYFLAATGLNGLVA